MNYVGLRQGNWETMCGYVYEVTIRLKDHAVVCSAYTPILRRWTNVTPTLIHCLVYAGSSSLCHVIATLGVN